MARVHGCERCLAGKVDYHQLQCAHFEGRTSQSIRWDEDNAFGFCGGCHIYVEHHPAEYTEWYINKMGEAAYDLLLARKRYHGKTDINALILYYLAKIKELEANADITGL